jgi:hypothetical protein
MSKHETVQELEARVRKAEMQCTVEHGRMGLLQKEVEHEERSRGVSGLPREHLVAKAAQLEEAEAVHSQRADDAEARLAELRGNAQSETTVPEEGEPLAEGTGWGPLAERVFERMEERRREKLAERG